MLRKRIPLTTESTFPIVATSTSNTHKVGGTFFFKRIINSKLYYIKFYYVPPQGSHFDFLQQNPRGQSRSVPVHSFNEGWESIICNRISWNFPTLCKALEGIQNLHEFKSKSCKHAILLTNWFTLIILMIALEIRRTFHIGCTCCYDDSIGNSSLSYE